MYYDNTKNVKGELSTLSGKCDLNSVGITRRIGGRSITLMASSTSGGKNGSQPSSFLTGGEPCNVLPDSK
jgi:hypothetical protein